MALKIIIGLGNPGEDFTETRHNIGFMFLDYFNKKESLGDFEFNKNLNAETLKSKLDKTSVVLVKPHSFVNKTGEVANKLVKSLKVKVENLIVIQDDLDIPFGNTKMSFEKNSGGHRGVASIIKSLKTKKFYRIRLGLGAKKLDQARQQSDKKRDEFVKDFVLSKFTKSESEELKSIFKEAYDKLMSLLK